MRLEESCARIVERYASKTAVCCGEVQLSYEQLDDASNRFALGLHALGVKFGDRVGLCMERSVSLIVAILGTYKAGAAYVALDPIYPDDRLRYMAVDSGVKRVVVDDSTEHRLEGGHLHIEQCLREGDHRKALRAPPSHADAPAYVLYTSGSSGTPKGTLVSHAQVGSLLGASRRLFDFDERDVWSQTHSYAFDFSVWEIWGALLNGGTLVIAPAHTVRDPRALVQALQDAGGVRSGHPSFHQPNAWVSNVWQTPMYGKPRTNRGVHRAR